MLRTASGVVLASATLGLTWAGPAAFAVLAGSVALVLLWEWSRLTAGAGLTPATIATGAIILVAVGLVASARPGWGLAAVLAAAGCAALLAGGRKPVMAAAGALYAGLPAVALIWFRADVPFGLESLVFLLIVVWATDIGAFLAGRLLGGPRLWVRVSPNKTWSGLLGGVTAAAICASLYVAWLGGTPGTRTAVLAGLLAILSQGGDLFESALKRAHGAKDSSNLIPGHGGFMDRVDGLVFAAVAAAAYAALLDPAHPAAALLGVR
jgi:phosphatidate cytidylyltransferase